MCGPDFLLELDRLLIKIDRIFDLSKCDTKEKLPIFLYEISFEQFSYVSFIKSPFLVFIIGQV